MAKATQKELEKIVKEIQEIAIKDGKSVMRGLGGGLQVKAQPNTGKLDFYCRNPNVKLGSVNKMTLEGARKKVEELKKKRKTVQVQQKREKDLSPTLAEYFPQWLDRYIARHVTQGEPLSAQYIRNIKSAIKHLHKMMSCRLNDIARDPLLFLNALECDQTSPHLRFYIRRILTLVLEEAFALGVTKHEYTQTLIYLKSKNNAMPRPKGTPHKHVQADELREVFFEPLKTQTVVFRAYFALLALTGFRPSEARLLKWDWIDWNKKIIIIPHDAEGANKTGKHSGRDLIRPLTKQMIQILNLMKKINEAHDLNTFVFESENKRQNQEPHAYGLNTLGKAVAVLGITKKHQLHGFRGTAYDWMTENIVNKPDCVTSNGKLIDKHTIELCLNHKDQDGVTDSYLTYESIEEIRSAFCYYDDYLEAHAFPPEFLELLQTKTGS